MTTPNSQKANSILLKEIIEEFNARILIDGASKVLASDVSIATSLAEATEAVRTPYGPTITIADRSESSSPQIPTGISYPVTTLSVDALPMDHFTHAVFGINGEDPKIVLQGLKYMVYALQPKGVAVVISLKQVSGEVVEGGEEGKDVTLGLEEKIKYQSRGKLESLEDVMYHAGFERGKIRTLDRRAVVGGRDVEAEIVLAMKWDQLTG